MAELRRCPFCGGKVTMTYSSYDNMYHVYHRGMPIIWRCALKEPIDIEGEFVRSLSEAADAWNRRAGEDG